MEKELRRNEEEGMIGGVCAGLAEYLNVEKIWVRLFFVLSIFFSFFGIGIAGFVVYVLMWIIVPKKPIAYPDYSTAAYQNRSYQHTEGGLAYAAEGSSYQKKKAQQRDRRMAGAVLVGIGFLLLILQLQVISWSFLFKLWPLVFVVSGISVISSAFYRRPKWSAESTEQAGKAMEMEDKKEG